MPVPSPYARAMSMPIWADSGMDIPADLELRRLDDLAAICLIGTSKVLGFVPSRFDATNLPELINRLRNQV